MLRNPLPGSAGRPLIFVLGMVFVLVSDIGWAKPVAHVGLLMAGESDHPFWSSVAEFAEAVAEDLNIDLEVRYSAENSYSIKHNGLELLDELGESDFFMSGYFRAVTSDFLDKAEKADINTIIYNTDILESDREQIGTPRGKYAHWLAHMVPDEAQAGYDLASVLLEQRRQQTDGQSADPTDMVAITGPIGPDSYHGVIPNLRAELIEGEVSPGREDSPVSLQRLAGLEKRIAQSGAANMLGYLDAYWLPDQARDLTGRLLKRNDVDLIWSASDAMALAAVDALIEADRVPGEDVLVGGFDWTQAGLDAVSEGKLAATMGGHFMEAGWALVLIYDYVHGKDFAGSIGTDIVTPMSAITADNIERYRRHFGQSQWSKIDFKRFTRVHNEQFSDYDFSLNAVFDNVQ